MKQKLKTLLVTLLLISSSALVHADVMLKAINGQQIAFSDLKGKWIFINYWASWCQPCLDEINELNSFYQENKDKIALFAVNYDALPLREQVILIKKLGIRYPNLSEDPARELKLGDLRGVPVTFVFNPQGKLSQTLYGPQT